MRNQLDRETSPYLLQHKDNPVHWRAWGPEALAEATAANKPILLSVGYAACHWCHVMAHESFEDAGTAAVMNELFVNIKVDREERLDIDTIYQTALAMLGEQGGWPLTMFLTPAGEPFWGGTYFPPEPRYGRPGFRDVLRRVSDVFHKERDTIERNRDALMQALHKHAQPPEGVAAPALDASVLDQIAQRLLREIDPVNGGIGGAPKFPNVSILDLLWRAHIRSGAAMYAQAVTLTLDRMSQGGIYDHLGGGYARYATDAVWLVPHFEKMLYDNAQLLELLAEVWAETRNPLYERRMRETAGWLLREMVAEGGGFAATQDADSEGEEGKFYVWTEAEIDALLGPRAGPFKRAYGVTPQGNWEGHTILNRMGLPALLTDDEERELAECRAILLAARERRIKPGWDDKVLADWNGLAIAALAHAGVLLGEPGWIEAAARAFAFVRDRMSEGGRLRHSWRAGQLRHSALLDDYSNMSHAALALHEATGEPDYLRQAEAWVAIADRHYWDGANGGYFLTADDAEALVVRSRSATDSAVPSGNGAMLGALARLWYLTGEARYRARADALVRAFAPDFARNVFGLPTLVNGFELLLRAQQVALIGAREARDTQVLLTATRALSLPAAVLSVTPPCTALPPAHPAAGKTQADGRATAYVCVGTTCSLPLTDAATLRAELARARVSSR